MPSPRSYLSYPPDYTELFKRAQAGESVTVEFPTAALARQFRGHLYAFRIAIRDDSGANAPAELLLMAPLVRFKLDGEKLIVYMQQEGRAVHKALKQAKKAILPVPTERHTS